MNFALKIFFGDQNIYKTKEKYLLMLCFRLFSIFSYHFLSFLYVNNLNKVLFPCELIDDFKSINFQRECYSACHHCTKKIRRTCQNIVHLFFMCYGDSIKPIQTSFVL